MADRILYYPPCNRANKVITRRAVLQSAEVQVGLGQGARSLSAALGEIMFSPVIKAIGSTVSVAGSVLEYKHAMRFSDGRAPNRNALIWVDGSGTASRHFIQVYVPLSKRMDSTLDTVQVSKRFRINTNMSQRVGGAAPKDAAHAITRLVTRWMDDETSSWAPLFERLWAGFYTAQFDVVAEDQVGRTPDTLWPPRDHLPDALIALRASTAGLSRLLVRERIAVKPTNLGIFDVFCAVITSHLGFHNHWAGSKPFLEMPEILIVPQDDRPEGYRAVYRNTSILNSRNWLLAIHWLLEQGLPSEDCLSGLELMMRHCVLFFSPFTTMISIAPAQRMVSCTNLADIVYTRYLVMSYKTATASLADRGAAVTAAIAALGVAAEVIAAEVALSVDPVGRVQDIGWLFWLHGCGFTRTDINTMLTQCSTTILIKIATWAADDAWEAVWVGRLDAIADLSLTPPVRTTAAQFMTDIANGGILDRSLSIPLFNFHETTTQFQSSGLDLLYAENFIGEVPIKSGLRELMRIVTPSKMILNLLEASVTCRSVVDFNAMVMGMSAFGRKLASRYCDSGDNIIDQVVKGSVSAPGQRQWSHAGLVGLDALMATCGLATSFALQVGSRLSIHTPGLWEEYRYLNLQVLHPLVQQSFCPGLPVAGGALDRKMIWVNDLPFHLGFQYGEDLTQQEFLGAIQLVGWFGNQHIAVTPLVNVCNQVRNENRALSWRMTDLPCRDSDFFPGVATLAVPPVWLVSTHLSTAWVYAPSTTHYCRSLYYLPHAADAYPMCEVPAGTAAEGTLHKEAEFYSSGKASYIKNAMRATNLQPPGLTTGGNGWGAPVGVAGALVRADMLGAIHLGYTRALKVVDTAQLRMDVLKPRMSVHLSANTSYLKIATRRGLSGDYPNAAGMLKTAVENGEAGDPEREVSNPNASAADREEIHNLSGASLSELQAQLAALQALVLLKRKDAGGSSN